MSETTSYYRCTKCKLACDRWETVMPSATASRPVTVTGAVEVHEGNSLCCNAPVQVVSDKRP